jgi:ribonuclease HII
MIGIDEVGRGCWAGPLLVVAARAKGDLPVGLADSKVLSKKKRESFYQVLPTVCDFGEGWVEPTEIDELGLAEAMRLAVSRALENLSAHFDDEIIMDGTIDYCSPEFTGVQCIARADATHPIVSAASIYAKVLRDTKMTELAMKYPAYGFEKHVGYGTKAHITALRQFGVTPLHRLSYKPIAQFA